MFSAATAQTVPVALAQATATLSQTGDSFFVAQAIDGNTIDGRGWAISPGEGQTQIAAFETVSDLGLAGGTLLSFTLLQNDGGSQNTLGRFRISVTTDNRNSFADGLDTGGDVTANWTVLFLTSLVSAGGATMTVQGDNSVLVSGTLPGDDTYTFSAVTGATAITGFRIEAIADPSLPGNGPGRSFNGNFTLAEFTITATAIPESATWAALSGAVVLGFAALRRRKN